MMERILLVEPNYKNKYPPIGLMKISSYFKAKKDFVQFHKGLMPQKDATIFDKVFITTLFTFDFEMCIQTIKYYEAIVGSKNVFVGGIASTIMPEKFLKEVPNINLLKGQLTSSQLLGYNDNINIDILPLDYDMLWDIEYEYPESNSYFIYTSRGCPRKCSFCAVKTLEPDFYDCQSIEEQIKRVDQKFGIKKNLLIMDNNILYSTEFEKNVEILEKLGFGVDNNVCKKNSNMVYYIQSLIERKAEGRRYDNLLSRIKKEIISLNLRRINNKDKEKIVKFLSLVELNDDVSFIDLLIKERDYINDFFDRYHYHKIKRYIDFNQGLDARLFTDDKAKAMSRLAVNPCRIAFDHLETKDTYLLAIETAVKHGIKNFSNYLLFNYKDKPEDLWTRLSINVEFCEKHKSDKVSLFSFPMKYASIEETNREYVGVHWCKKFLRSINIILNVTSGIVAKEKDFFERAYGKTSNDFIEILSMPDDFIRHRKFFDEIGLSKVWKEEFYKLTETDKQELLNILSEAGTDSAAQGIKHEKVLDRILSLYSIKKSAFEKNPTYFKRLYNL